MISRRSFMKGLGALALVPVAIKEVFFGGPVNQGMGKVAWTANLTVHRPKGGWLTYSGYEPMNISDEDIFHAAEFYWKEAHREITLEDRS